MTDRPTTLSGGGGSIKRLLQLPRRRSSQSDTMPSVADDICEGWLLKWTNYMKGYKERWFVLKNGYLMYYRGKDEIGSTCRGTINMAGATVYCEDKANIVVSTGAQQYHLRADSEKKREEWYNALEHARSWQERHGLHSLHSGNSVSSQPLQPNSPTHSQPSLGSSAVKASRGGIPRQASVQSKGDSSSSESDDEDGVDVDNIFSARSLKEWTE